MTVRPERHTGLGRGLTSPIPPRAQHVGRAKSTITNTLRLLDLDPSVQASVAEGRLTAGHARALGGLPVELQARVATTVVSQAFSVRQAEELVRRLREPRAVPAPQ